MRSETSIPSFHCSPQRIGFSHLANQSPDLGTHTGVSASLAPGNAGPEKAEALPMPADDCLRPDQ